MFWTCSACNHWKRKWCKSAAIDLEKFVKSHQVNLFLAGFGHLKPLCSGGLEGESPSSDCRRLVCSSSMLLLCRGALSREKTGKEPTNISCSNYTILYRKTLLKLRKILAQKKCYFIGVGRKKCWDETILFICLHSATIKRNKKGRNLIQNSHLFLNTVSNPTKTEFIIKFIIVVVCRIFCWYPSSFLCLQKFLAHSYISMGSIGFCSCIFKYISQLSFFEIL